MNFIGLSRFLLLLFITFDIKIYQDSFQYKNISLLIIHSFNNNNNNKWITYESPNTVIKKQIRLKLIRKHLVYTIQFKVV